MEGLNNTYERALVHMHKMPRIWVEYLEFLMEQRYVTKVGVAHVCRAMLLRFARCEPCAQQ